MWPVALFHFSSRGTGRAAEPDTMSLGSTTTGAYLVLMGVTHSTLPSLNLTFMIKVSWG